MMTRIAIIVLVVLGFITLVTTCGYERIDSGHVGIEVQLFGSDKGVQDVTLVNGGQFFNRWTEEIYEFPTFVQHKVFALDSVGGIDEQISVTTNDALTLSFDVGFDYQVIPERVPEIFKKYRKELNAITNEFLRTAVRNSYNDVAGQYSSDSILTNRTAYEKKVKKLLDDKLAEDFTVVQLGIVGKIRVPKPLEDAINAKIEAIQNALKAQNQVVFEKAEAGKKIERAKGDSAALVINASGEKLANILKQQSLTPILIQQQLIDKWDGKLPQYGVVPQLFKDIAK